MERLSNDELDVDKTDSNVTHKKAYPVAAPRRGVSTRYCNYLLLLYLLSLSIYILLILLYLMTLIGCFSGESDERSYQNIPKSQREREQGGEAYQNIPTPRPKSSGAPQPAKRLSTHGAPDKQVL